MLALRVEGWSFTSLAFLYGCDRTSIETQCKKYGAEPIGRVYTIERIVVYVLRPKIETKWKLVDGERINKGKMYEDYLNQYPHRKNKKQA